MGLLLLASAAAEAQTTRILVSNSAQTADDSANTSGNDHAQLFHTGANTAGYTFTRLFVNSDDAQNDDFDVEICEADTTANEFPTSTCTALTAPATFAGNVLFTQTGLTLSANTNYVVVVKQRGTGSVELNTTTSGGEDTGLGLSDWSITDKFYWKSGSTWMLKSGSDEALRIIVRGYANTVTDATDATLSALSVSGATLSPAFAAAQPTYKAVVANSVTQGTLSSEKGCRAILDAAAWHFGSDVAAHAAFVAQFAARANHFERAMTTLLDHPACWRGATRFYQAEPLPAWRKRTDLPRVPAAVDDASLQALAAGISTYFHRTEGRGTHCVVEPVRRGALDYFFAYPEDYAQHRIEWVGGQFGQRPHHPAFEVVYVYSQPDGALDVNFRGARTAVEPLQSLFAATILKQPALPPDPTDDRVYDLHALRDPGFEFVYDRTSGIQDVVVTQLRLASRVTAGDRLTLEADAVGRPMAVYDLLARLRPAAALHLYDVTQVELSASVITTAGRPPQRVLIRLTRPNACSLPYDEVGLSLRAMLSASGIEPAAPAKGEEAPGG